MISIFHPKIQRDQLNFIEYLKRKFHLKVLYITLLFPILLFLYFQSKNGMNASNIKSTTTNNIYQKRSYRIYQSVTLPISNINRLRL